MGQKPGREGILAIEISRHLAHAESELPVEQAYLLDPALSVSCVPGRDVHHWLPARERPRQVTISASGEPALSPAML
jgi:wyosine [tRNA(Phe)-imidazoG37] synthetase (radical SAM superfamily)